MTEEGGYVSVHYIVPGTTDFACGREFVVAATRSPDEATCPECRARIDRECLCRVCQALGHRLEDGPERVIVIRQPDDDGAPRSNAL